MNRYIRLEEVFINPAQIVLSKELYNKINGLKYENGQCLENAKKVAKAIGCLIVEGIVVFNDNSSIRHAWNVLEDGSYFDMTAESVWPSIVQSEPPISSEIKIYHKCECHSRSDYNNKGKNIFLSDAPIISNCRNAIVVIFTTRDYNDFIDKLLPNQDANETVRDRYLNSQNRSDFMTIINNVIQNEYEKVPKQILDYIL